MKRWKRIVLALICLVFVGAGHLSVYGSSADEQLRQWNEWYQRYLEQLEAEERPTETPLPNNPKIKLQSPTVYTIKGGGRKDTLELTIKNVGSSHAQNILTQAVLPDNAPFTLSFVDNSNSIHSLYSNATAKIKVEVVVDKNAKSGTYNITLNHSYKNEDNVNSSETDTFSLKIENDAVAPSVALYDFQNSLSSIGQGDTFTVSAVLENVSSQDIRDVQIVIEGLKAGEVSLSGSSGSVYYKELSPNSVKDVSFTMETHNKIKAGSYPITFTAHYRDTDGESYETTFYYYVNVSGSTTSDEKSMVAIQNVGSPRGTFGVDENFTVTMDIVNNSNIEATNVKITAETDTEGGIVPKTASVQQIRSLMPGDINPLAFSFAATSKSKSQSYTIGFLVEYETGVEKDDGSFETMTFNQYVGVNVFNPDADDDDKKISVPKIIVSRYSSDPTIVKAGQNFNLNITFQNTHSSKSIENVKAYLTSVEDVSDDRKRGSVFIPVDSSNTFYIDSIGPKAEIERQFTFYTVPDATPQNYIVSINFEYEDADHEVYESIEQVGINVKQVTKLETYNMDLPTEGYIGQPVMIYFDFYNTGKVALSNLKMELVGNFDTENPVSYFSNFTPGSSNYYEGTIIPTEPGLQNGQIIISYEDDTGEVLTETRDFEFNVQEMVYDMDMDGMFMPEPEPTGLNPWLVGGVAVGVVAVAGVVFFVLKKRKRKQEGLDIDE